MSAKLTTNFKPEVPSGIVAQGAHASTILLYTLMIVLPQSYFTLKLLALVCFLIAHSIMVWYSRSLRVKISDVIFYAATGALGAIWAAVGSFNGNAFGGIGDGVKLYIAWSVLFTAIITLRRNAGALQGLHFTFVTSTFLICGLNFAAVSDVLLGYGYMPTGLIDELGLHVQLYDGFIKLHGNNIASLLFLVPYLMTRWLFKVEDNSSRFWTAAALIVGLGLVIVSGRRALWVTIAILPVIIYCVAQLSGHKKQLRFSGSTMFLIYFFAVMLMAIIVVSSASNENGVVEYLLLAFSSEDERTIQKYYLLEGFLQYPLAGSGFGGYAGYMRNAISPWLYELTYHQMLFNFGILGSVSIATLFCAYFWVVFRSLHHNKENVSLKIGVLVGFLGILIGSYSNPYMQFFDGMLFIMFFVMMAEGYRRVIRQV